MKLIHTPVELSIRKKILLTKTKRFATITFFGQMTKKETPYKAFIGFPPVQICSAFFVIFDINEPFKHRSQVFLDR